jgi:hypothetical protein
MTAMPTPEEKYYDAMNTVLAPVRWAKSLVQTLLLIAIAIFIGLAYPLIQLSNGEPLTLFSFVVPALTLLIIFTFFYTPYYTIFAVFVGGFTIAAIAANTDMSKYGVCLLIFALFAFGILQKYIRNRIKYNRIYEEAHRTAAKEKERKQSQQEHERKRRQAEARERGRFRTENSKVFTGIAGLLSTCRAPAVEIMRAARAIEGTDIEVEPKTVIWTDIGFILASFRSTGSADDAYIEKLWEEVTRRIKPPDANIHCFFESTDTTNDANSDKLWEEFGNIFRPTDKIAPFLSGVPNRGVKQLRMILVLADYDKVQGTNLSSRAASTYLSIVSAVAAHCDGSLAAKMVADKYAELLGPYIHDNGGNGYAESSTSSVGSQKPVCQKCAKAFGVLGLPLGASKAEVRQKRRAWAEVLHPDQLSSKSEKARDAAELQLKCINEACDQILRCRCSLSTN